MRLAEKGHKNFLSKKKYPWPIEAIVHDAFWSADFLGHQDGGENKKDDLCLKEDLIGFVRHNWRKREILDFMETKYPMCAWSERTLTRRLQYFEINFTDYDVDIQGWKWNIGKPNIHILSGIFFEF